MNDIFDVAKYILQKEGSLAAMKLHTLLYYCNSWSLVWDDVPLFDNKFEAWTNTAVCRDLYNIHQGCYTVTLENISCYSKGSLTEQQIESIDTVLKSYGCKTIHWLCDQVRFEAPWQIARKGLGDTERGEQEITLKSIIEYYKSIK